MVLLSPSLDLPVVSRGKVNVAYDLGTMALLVLSDRISVGDVALNQGLPDKGRLFCALSAFWFSRLSHLGPHHLLSIDPSDFPATVQPYLEQITGRAMLCRKVEGLHVECNVWAHLHGKIWQRYEQRHGVIYHRQFPPGLRWGDRLPELVIVLSTKGVGGVKDRRLSPERAAEILGSHSYYRLLDWARHLFIEAEAHLKPRNLYLADIKLEFGLQGKDLILIDELLTPMAARYCCKSVLASGKPQPDPDEPSPKSYLARIGWHQGQLPPPIPEAIITAVANRYRALYGAVTSIPTQQMHPCFYSNPP